MIEGRVALVTGAGKGIGAATALELARAGANVVVAARTTADLEKVVAAIEEAGGKGLAVSADVSDPGDVERIAAEARAAFGDVEILVNNAAVIDPIASILEADPDAWERALRINVLGAYRVLRTFVPPMLEHGWGRVVGVSSLLVELPLGLLSAYGSTKAAFEYVHRVLAAECAGTGVRVNVIWPGTVDTPMQTHLRDEVARHVPAARAAADAIPTLDPSIPAKRILELCAEDLALHGARIDVDGVGDKL